MISGIFNMFTNYISDDCITTEDMNKLNKRNNYTIDEGDFYINTKNVKDIKELRKDTKVCISG